MLTTERLLLRRIEAGDWREIQAIWKDIDGSELAQYDRKKETDDRSVREHIAIWASYAESREHQFWAVCLEGRLIGFATFHQQEDGAFELGYGFHSAWRGKGYARESIRAILQELRKQGVRKVIAGTALANLGSVRLLAALGFTQYRTETVSFYEDAAGNPIEFLGGWFERLLP